jgi:hypothetical protein
MCNRWYRLHCLTSHSSSVTQRLPCAHNSPKSWYIHSLISFPSDHLLNLLLLLLLLLIIIIITKLAHLCCLMIRRYVYCSCWVSILWFLVTPMKTFCFCLVGFICRFFCRSEFVISSTYVILEILTGWWWWWWWFTSSIAVGIQLQNRYLICINFDQFFCFGRGGCVSLTKHDSHNSCYKSWESILGFAIIFWSSFLFQMSEDVSKTGFLWKKLHTTHQSSPEFQSKNHICVILISNLL